MSPLFHRQNQALTILAIATAVVGFGLFGADFNTGTILLDSSLTASLARAKIGLGIAALVSYATVLVSVAAILRRRTNVTGRQLVAVPLHRMYLVLFFIGLIFITGIFERAGINLTTPFNGPSRYAPQTQSERNAAFPSRIARYKAAPPINLVLSSYSEH